MSFSVFISVKDETSVRNGYFGSFGDFLHSDILLSEKSGHNSNFCLGTFSFPQLLSKRTLLLRMVQWEQINKVWGEKYYKIYKI